MEKKCAGADFQDQERRAELWQLQRNKVDEPHNLVMGKSSGSLTEVRSEHLLTGVGFHAKQRVLQMQYLL